MGGWKLDLEQVPDLLSATHVPALVPGRLTTRLRLFYRATLRDREAQWVIGWDQWVDLARRLGITVKIDTNGYAHTCWQSKAHWAAHREAVQYLRSQEGA